MINEPNRSVLAIKLVVMVTSTASQYQVNGSAESTRMKITSRGVALRSVMKCVLKWSSMALA